MLPAKINQSTICNWIAVLLFSAALLIPCFWQSHIQSADLASHIYNAWLATQIHSGAAPGLSIAPQSTNVLFDLILEWLFVRVGPDLALRFAVSLSVLIFAWGAVLFIFRVAGKNWWFAAPCVAMLAYGYTFHIGFFNFYLSMGLCLWYLALSWGKSWRIHAAATALLVLAWTAHPFPVVWAVGVSAYAAIARRLQPRQRGLLLALGLAAIVVARFLITSRYAYSWSLLQVSFITGANQIGLFGLKYVPAIAALLLLWMILFSRLEKREGLANLVVSIPFQLWLLNAAAVCLIPDRIMFPQFGLPFGFITSRLALASALILCTVLARVTTGKMGNLGLVLVALWFFSLLYADDRRLNRLENSMTAIVRQLPSAQRAIALAPSQSLYSLCFQHQLDRVCIGHCLSYANYEPSSRQFRIRAQPENGIVLSNYADVDAIATGTYVVQARDLPLSLIHLCGAKSEEVCSRPLRAGEKVGSN